MEEKIIYYGTLLELYGELLTDKQYSAIDKYYNMDLSLSEIAQEDKITRQAVRDNIKKAEEKLEFFESKLKLYKNFKKEDNIVSKLEKNIINLTAKITTLSIDKYEKEKLDKGENMAFEGLSSRLQNIIRKIKGSARITEKDLKEMTREIKLTLLEADVNFMVVKKFIKNIEEKALGEEVLKSLTPGQQVVKIVKDELTKILRSRK